MRNEMWAARGLAAFHFRWWPELVAGAMIALVLVTPRPSTAAVERATPVVAGTHERLERLMSERDGTPSHARRELLAIRELLRPASAMLRAGHRELASALDAELSQALAQVSDGGEERFADRREFEVSYLVPLAATLSDVRDSLTDTTP